MSLVDGATLPRMAYTLRNLPKKSEFRLVVIGDPLKLGPKDIRKAGAEVTELFDYPPKVLIAHLNQHRVAAVARAASGVSVDIFKQAIEGLSMRALQELAVWMDISTEDVEARKRPQLLELVLSVATDSGPKRLAAGAA